MTAAQYARHTNNLLRPSTPFAQSPHVQLLQEYLQEGEKLLQPDRFQQTGYFRNGLECIQSVGSYFGCVKPEQLVGAARAFIDRFEGKPFRHATNTPFDNSFTAAWKLPLVRGIQYSDCYELVDGNHRLAIAMVRGEKAFWAWAMAPKVLTPLQQLVLDGSWTDGARLLYQPIQSPELGRHWPCVRKCTDRFEMIHNFLRDHSMLPGNGRTSLDIACSYGWFLKAFRDLGFQSHGIEIDWASIQLGRLVYGLEPESVTRGEVVHTIQKVTTRYDVTSCFSLLHHFVTGAMSITAEQMLQHIDRITGQVFFMDMGQEHELWLRKALAGWNPDSIENWLRRHSSFTRIYRLGTDSDGQQSCWHNYGRTLFACMR